MNKTQMPENLKATVENLSTLFSVYDWSVAKSEDVDYLSNLI